MTSTPSAARPVTLTEVTAMADTLASMAQRLDPDALPDRDVAGVISQLGRAVRTVDGMFTLAARRAEETDAHRTSGHRSAADLVADATGTTSRTAKARLRTSVQLTDQPQVRDAVAGGKLSVGQAQIVADTAAVDPDATDGLLHTAATTDVHGLRKEAQRIRRDADPDPGATRRRHYLSRHFRSWTDERPVERRHDRPSRPRRPHRSRHPRRARRRLQGRTRQRPARGGRLLPVRCRPRPDGGRRRDRTRHPRGTA